MFWNVQVKESKKTCKALLKKFLKCTLDLINRCLQNLKCSLFMLQDWCWNRWGNLINAYFFFYTVWQCIYLFSVVIDFLLDWKKLIFYWWFVVLYCYLPKNVLEHPTFIWGTVIYLWLMYGTCVDTVHQSKITTTSFCQEEFIFDLWLLSIWEMCDLMIPWEKLIQCSSPK